MKLLAITALLCLVQHAQGWARRRRLPSKRSVGDEDVSMLEKRSVVSRSVAEVSLETCVADVTACGFTIKCACCSAPSFSSCGGTNLIGSPALKLLRKRRKRGEDGNDSETDEAGCHLRSVSYNDQDICIPGNVAAMFAVTHQTTEGDCYPVYPLNCVEPLADDKVYYQYIYVPKDKVPDTLTALEKAGHFCYAEEVLGGLKCAI